MLDVINKKKSNSNKPEIENVEKEKVEYKLIGTFARRKGKKIFQYNPKNMKISEVVVSHSDTITLVPIDGKLVADLEMEKVTVNSANIFFESLNYKNAIKRFSKFKRGEIKELSNMREYTGGIKLW